MSRDLYAEVTQKVIAELETGAAPWVKPWKGGSFMPSNVFTGKSYRGINVPLLWSSGADDLRFATFKQCQEQGANVKKGAKGNLIVFFKPWQVRKIDADTNEATEKTVPMLRAYFVFNVADIEGLPESAPKAAENARLDAAESLISQAAIKPASSAFYRPSDDSIGMPPIDSFISAEHYYATALHELTHWTGHKSRLDRNLSGRFGDQSYAAEELIAELGSAFLCAELGIRMTELRHAGYIEHWLKLLRSDKRAVLTAASAAQKASDFINKRQAVAEQLAA